MTIAESNQAFLDDWEPHPWGRAIRAAHEQLTRIEPGYEILDIKSKFNQLRYYVSIPTVAGEPEAKTRHRWARVDGAIARAEGWVDGYEAAYREIEAFDEVECLK